jgi:hypothetical protein
MSTKGNRRSVGITLTATQRTAESSATCHDELPPPNSSTTAISATAAASAGNSAHKKAPFRALLTSTLPVTPPVRDDLSSLNPVSFSDREIYFFHLREGLINVSQTLAIPPKMTLRSWHRSTAERRASTAAEAPSERRLSGSRARARLCHLSHHSAERRRDWTVMRD